MNVDRMRRANNRHIQPYKVEAVRLQRIDGNDSATALGFQFCILHAPEHAMVAIDVVDSARRGEFRPTCTATHETLTLIGENRTVHYRLGKRTGTPSWPGRYYDIHRIHDSALAKEILTGIEQAHRRKTRDLGDFSQHAADDVNDEKGAP